MSSQRASRLPAVAAAGRRLIETSTKEETKMNYSKPEVKTLGKLTTVVERTGKQSPMATEPTRREFNPAYDLDD